MNRLVFSFIVILFLILFASGESWYGDSLKLDTKSYNLIIDSWQRQLIIDSPGKAKLHVLLRFLVKNKRGLQKADLTIEENTLQKLKSLNGRILDSSGKEIKKIKRKDFIQSNISGFLELATDAKSYYYSPADNQIDEYPVMLEYEYSLELKSTFGYNQWMVRDTKPIKEELLTILIPKSYSFNYNSGIINEKPLIEDEGSRFLYTWKLKNVKPFPDDENDAPPESFDNFSIFFAPGLKKVNQSEFSMNSWMDMTSWLRTFYFPTEPLPVEITQILDSLKINTKNEKQLIREWYRIAVEKTRYLMFNPGILGWVPLSCNEIWFNKYGDCKNLTQLIVSGLRYAGFQAYPALALTRDNGVLRKNFVASQFNHVIGVVFLKDDTLFLENTADVLSAGQFGWMDEGIDVLVLQPDTVFFIRTPETESNDNQWINSYDIFLHNDGSILVRGRSKVTGNYAIRIRQSHAFDSDKDIRESFYKSFNTTFPMIENFKFQARNIRNNFDLPIYYETEFEAKNYTKKKYPRMFLKLAMFHQKDRSDLPKKEREFPVFFWFRNELTDTVKIHLPHSYAPEALPKSVSLTYPFGEYQYEVEQNDTLIIFIRKFKIKKRIISKKEYQKYRKFMRKIIKQDKKKLVIIRKKGIIE